MSVEHDTSSTGTAASGSAETNGNGHRPDPFADHTDSGPNADLLTEDIVPEPKMPQAFPGVMLAYRLGVEPSDEISAHITGADWNALRDIGRRYGIRIDAANHEAGIDGTRFEELDAVPRGWSVRVCPDLEATTRREVAEFVSESVLYTIADPEAEWQYLTEKAEAVKTRRGEHARKLRAANVNPRTTFSLAEIERVCGLEVAEAARHRIDAENKMTWDMGVDNARKRRRNELPYLVSAGDLVADHKVEPGVVAVMSPATLLDRHAAWALLGAARSDRKIGNTGTPVGKRWLTLDDLDRLPQAEYLIDKLLVRGAAARLSGPPGSLKTFIALDMALSIASGKPFAGSDRFKPARAGHVVYVVGEGGSGINSRITAWCRHNNVSRSEVGKNIALLNGSAQLASTIDMADVEAKVRETGAVLVVFDTQARCTVGLEENSATAQGMAVKGIADLIANTGTAALVLHHPKKGSADPRGSSAWNGALDVELIVVRDGMDLDLRVTKMKDDELPGHPYPFKATKVSLPGDPKGSLVIEARAVSYDDAIDPDNPTPFDLITGDGRHYVKPVYEFVQQHAVPGVGLTMSQIAAMAGEKVPNGYTSDGTAKMRQRVCSGTSARRAAALLEKHGWLVLERRDSLGHSYFAPKEPTAPDPSDIAALTGEQPTDAEPETPPVNS